MFFIKKKYFQTLRLFIFKPISKRVLVVLWTIGTWCCTNSSSRKAQSQNGQRKTSVISPKNPLFSQLRSSSPEFWISLICGLKSFVDSVLTSVMPELSFRIGSGSSSSGSSSTSLMSAIWEVGSGSS